MEKYFSRLLYMWCPEINKAYTKRETELRRRKKRNINHHFAKYLGPSTEHEDQIFNSLKETNIIKEI